MKGSKSSLIEPLTLSLVGLAGYGLVFVTNVILSRLMGGALFGDYSVAFAALMIFTSIALLGTDNAASRFIPSLYRSGNRAGLRDYIAWNLRRLVLPFCIAIGVAVAIILVVIIADALGYAGLDQYHLAFHTIWLAPLAAFSLLLGSYYVSIGHHILGGVFSNLAVNGLILGFFAIAVWVFAVPFGRGGMFLVVWGLSFACLIGIQLITLRYRDPDLYVTFRAAVRRPAAEIDRKWQATSLWMLITTINNIVLWHLDLFIVEIVAPDEAMTGYYAATLLVARMLHLIPVYIMFMVRPKVGYAFDKPAAYPTLQRAIDGANAIVFTSSIIMLAVILFWAGDILDLFGPGYRVAETALIILAIGVFVGAMTRQSRTILMASGSEKVVSRTSFVGLVLLAALGFPATYFWSIDGIAIVSGTIVAGQNLIFFAVARRRLPGIRPLSLI